MAEQYLSTMLLLLGFVIAKLLNREVLHGKNMQITVKQGPLLYVCEPMRGEGPSERHTWCKFTCGCTSLNPIYYTQKFGIWHKRHIEPTFFYCINKLFYFLDIWVQMYLKLGKWYLVTSKEFCLSSCATIGSNMTVWHICHNIFPLIIAAGLYYEYWNR